jgi:hypothetical protein
MSLHRWPENFRSTLALGRGQRRRGLQRDARRPLRPERLEDRLVPAIFWDGGPTGSGTNWNDPLNWVGDVLPGSADDAQIDSSFAGITVTSSSNVGIRSVTSAAALEITAGTFALSFATSQIDGPFTASGGILRLTSVTLNGTGTLTNSATTELVNSTLNVGVTNQE